MSFSRRDFTLSLLAATSASAITGTAAAQPAPAGTIPAQQYLPLASKGGQFAEEVGRLGFEKAQSPAVRRFARAEVVEQVNVSDKLAAATGGAPMMAGPAPGPGGLVGGVVAAPFAIAGAAANVAGAALSAPFVAAGAVLGVPRDATITTDAQKAAILQQLNAMPAGPDFDAMFVDVQYMGHGELYAVHGGYAQAGDDPTLRRVARSTLPLIRLHRAQLRQLGARPMAMS